MEPYDTNTMTAAQIAAKTGMSLAEAELMVAVREGTWAGDVLDGDDRGNATPIDHGPNYRP